MNLGKGLIDITMELRGIGGRIESVWMEESSENIVYMCEIVQQ